MEGEGQKGAVDGAPPQELRRSRHCRPTNMERQGVIGRGMTRQMEGVRVERGIAGRIAGAAVEAGELVRVVHLRGEGEKWSPKDCAGYAIGRGTLG